MREGDLTVKRLDGQRAAADLGTKRLDAKCRDELLDLIGLRLTGRRLTSTMQSVVAMTFMQAAAANGDDDNETTTRMGT